ncbi:histidine phosphatase family protein [Lacticaseibacillus pabuli]|uniref:Histidine phosphatase family protein n=1 Tax=Lacticaseibacillus pabuli TaxID=3025672 RepID=A0ABY7WRN2_9LACO|nr:histidine phosphatase family protein [Lacticaseibacillus sp. KACC 23028]WDF82843.1 histidine phosphatase family protein [Lacticaseibacillus sp. KACC 23028]
MAVELWLTRHGETKYNVEGVVQGIVNSDLTELGAQDAQALGRGFAKDDVKFDAAYSSDLKRAADTAQIALAAAHIDIPVTQLEGLREQNFGMFDGGPETQRQGALTDILGKAGIQNIKSLNMKQMVELVHIIDKHNGHGHAESVETSVGRFNAAMLQIAKTAEEKHQENVFVVAHGAIIWLWLNSIGMPDSADFIKNVAVSKIMYTDKGFTLLKYNDRKYVEAGGGTKNVEAQQFNLN